MAEILLMNDVISSSSSDDSVDSENSDTHYVFCTLQKEIRRRVWFLIFVKKGLLMIDVLKKNTDLFAFGFINLYVYHYLI
jgi:hypothetical protein